MLISEVSKFLKLGQNCGFLAMFFPWNYFICGTIPYFFENSYQGLNRLLKDIWFHLIFSGKMQEEFFSHCDSHYKQILRRMLVEMNTLIMGFTKLESNGVGSKCKMIYMQPCAVMEESMNQVTQLMLLESGILGTVDQIICRLDEVSRVTLDTGKECKITIVIPYTCLM